LIISLVFGGKIISSLKRLQVGETVRELGLEGQKAKEGTPTMGGIIIIMAILIPCLLLAKIGQCLYFVDDFYHHLVGLIGGADDYIKVFLKNKDGLSGKTKYSDKYFRIDRRRDNASFG
jgi:phospho-N-acetylmuramoyl-pentapeptide-transferase